MGIYNLAIIGENNIGIIKLIVLPNKFVKKFKKKVFLKFSLYEFNFKNEVLRFNLCVFNFMNYIN